MRILLVADTHIGFDLPRQPRVARRRRGHDFLHNFRRALQPAVRGEVDLVVHGGDLLFRSKVHAGLVEMAMTPLVEVASGGTPVYLVPGNHERSRIPLHLWATHPGIHIFDRPRTFVRQIRGRSLAISGFPYLRGIRHRFSAAIDETGCRGLRADAAILCMHQALEGARVGAGRADFTFRRGDDVVRGRDIPPGFSAILSGHIHRAQLLRRDLAGAALAAPVVYPGSVERTSWAERDEPKGFAILNLTDAGLGDLEWQPLPARPMVDLALDSSCARETLEEQLRSRLSQLRDDAVVRVHLNGPWTAGAQAALSAANLRVLAPSTMNISLARTREASGASTYSSTRSSR